MGKLLLLAIGIAIGLLIAARLRGGGGSRGRGHDLTAPPRLPNPSAPHGSQSDGEDAEVIALIRQGRKIEAIKRLREINGVGLAEAKDAVERIESTLR